MSDVRSILESASCSAEVKEYVLTQLGVANIEEFVCLVATSTYEAELKTLIIDQVPSAKDKPVELARLRSAWRKAKAELLKIEDRSRRGLVAQDDAEECLEPALQESLMQTFQRLYGVKLSIHLTPSDLLLAKVYRELQKRTPTVIDVARVRSLHQASKPSSERKISLAANLTFRLDEVPDQQVKSLIDYFNAIRILGHAYALAGHFEVESQVPGTKVRMAPLQQQLEYADMLLRCASSLDAPVSWVKCKDEATRSRMMELVRASWSQGEALSQAMKETELWWLQPPAPSVPKRDLDSDSPGRASKTLRTGNEWNRRRLCKKWNDNRGCTNKSCPDEHRCDALKPDSNICGAKEHNRLSCPFFTRR